MKKFFSILSVAALALLTVASCQKKEEAHVPGQPDVDGCYGVYFPVQEATGYHIYDPTQELTATFTVARKNTKGAITGLPIVVSSSDKDLFEIGSIDFADGEQETTFTVDFPNAEEGKEYQLQIEVTDPQYASIYNSATTYMNFSFMQVKMEDFLNPETNKPAVFTINSRWDGSIGPMKATLKYYEVNGIRTGVFTSIDTDKDQNPEGFWHSVPEVTLNIRWYTKNQNSDGYDFVELPKQYFGYDYNDGNWLAVPVDKAATPIFVYDYPWYWIERGYSWGDGSMQENWLAEAIKTGQKDGSYPVSYYDGNGGFFFNIYFYIPGLGGWSPDSYGTVAIAEGFTRVDYTLELEAEYPDAGSTTIYATAGVDIASLKYAVYEGELSKIQIEGKLEEIEKDSSASVFSDFVEDEGKKYGAMDVTVDATGLYTLVALALDADGKVQNSGSVVFKFVAGEDAAEYAVELNAFTEDTPSRYVNYHTYDSFGYGISGKDLTDVHVAVFPEATVAKYGSDVVLDAVKSDESGKYALTEDQVAEVNGEGGYYDVLSGQNPATTYYVIAWATNGTMDDFAIAAYTTDKLPYVWNSLGEGTLTDGLLMPDWSKDDVTVACDLYEEANTPGLFMVTGFQLALAAKFYGVDESVLVPYEGENGNWWNSEIVIDATNPNDVFIEEQQYGIYTNGTYQYALIEAEGGTYDGSKITFPANKMYIGYNGNGKWYYGNPDGTFCITFPTSAGAPALTAASTGSVKTEPQHAGSKVFEKPQMRFERDPQPVQAKVTSSTARKEKDSSSKKTLAKNLETR